MISLMDLFFELDNIFAEACKASEVIAAADAAMEEKQEVYVEVFIKKN